MLTIGLTGGIGSGKTTVANFFAELGITVIDTDQLARDVVAPDMPAFQKILVHFGKHILNAAGQLDRKKLRSIIFNDPQQKLWLEKLLHPLIRAEMKTAITNAKSPYCIAVIPLLAETEPNPIIDHVLVVDAFEDQQIERAIKRDQMTPEQIMAIMKTQVNREKRLSIANDVIYNDKNLEHLKQQVLELHHKYLKLAENAQ